MRKFSGLLYQVAMHKHALSENDSLTEFTKAVYPLILHNLGDMLPPASVEIENPSQLEQGRKHFEAKRAELIQRKNQLLERHRAQLQAVNNKKADPTKVEDEPATETEVKVKHVTRAINVKTKTPNIERVINRVADACVTVREVLQTEKVTTLESFEWSIPNGIMVFTKVLDYTLIFSAAVQMAMKQLLGSFTEVQIITAFDFHFGTGIWLSSLVAVAYFLLVFFSLDDLRKNTVGLDEFRQVAPFGHRKYLMALGLNVCSNTLISRALVYCLYAGVCVEINGVLVQ